MVTQAPGKERDTRRFERESYTKLAILDRNRIIICEKTCSFYLCLALKYVTFSPNVTSDVMCKTV